jgi:ABC-2 type transport system permease protein
MLHRILFLIYKEVLAVLQDRKSRMVLILPPIIQLVVFTFAATLDVKNASIAILNRDNGEQALELAQRFHGSPTFTNIRYLQGVQEIAPYIDNQLGVMVVSIDEQFSRNLNAQKQADVQIIMDGRKSNTAQIVAGYASRIIDQFNQDFSQKKGITRQNAVTAPRYWYNPNLLYYWFNVPSLSGILTMLVGMIITSLSVARERELGTFDQLLVSPLSPFEILVGKTVPAIIIAMAEGSIIVMAGIFLYQIPFTGSIFVLYLGMFTFICSIVGVGLFISSLCSTQQQAILGSYIFISPAVLLSGFATPIENMPDWLQQVTYLNPLRYYLVIAKGVFLKAMPFELALAEIWPMIPIAIVTLTIAGLFFRSRLD